MTEEKLRLEAKIEEGRIEMRGLENSRVGLEMENRRLLERVNSLDQHMVPRFYRFVISSSLTTLVSTMKHLCVMVCADMLRQ